MYNIENFSTAVLVIIIFKMSLIKKVSSDVNCDGCTTKYFRLTRNKILGVHKFRY
jgi:hypothetical protein